MHGMRCNSTSAVFNEHDHDAWGIVGKPARACREQFIIEDVPYCVAFPLASILGPHQYSARAVFRDLRDLLETP